MTEDPSTVADTDETVLEGADLAKDFIQAA